MIDKVFINRTLNIKKIKYLGFDMDHTLVRYDTQSFEAISHQILLNKLVSEKGYPFEIKELKFDYRLAIRGLVMDSKNGNILKLSRHGAIRISYHGTKKIDFKQQKLLYKSTYIDLNDPNYETIDTSFSIALFVAFSQLVDVKDQGLQIPDYLKIASDLIELLDHSHQDGTLKEIVRQDLDKYIVKDPMTVNGLEQYRNHGKKLFVLTNSDFEYTKLLLDHAINPFLTAHSTWMDLFDICITHAQKPRFFYDRLRFLKVNPLDGTMTNYNGKLQPGIYQGGCASIFAEDLNLNGDEILYIGDHIYGDILRLKKDCAWRTAMVVEELEEEIRTTNRILPITQKIDDLMNQKEPLEEKLVGLITQNIDSNSEGDEAVIAGLQDKITNLDKQIATLIIQQQKQYNLSWGQIFRTGNEESYFAHQVDRFACIYMSKLADLLRYSPRSYFRAHRRLLAHEV